jgi:hypothetical protein
MFRRAWFLWKSWLARQPDGPRGECSVRVRGLSQTHAADSERLARARDVSPRGLNLLLDQPYADGTLLSIQPAGDAVAPTVLATVVRGQAQPGGGWLLFCTFARDLTHEDLLAFGAPRPRAAAPPPPARLPLAAYQRVPGANPKQPAEVVGMTADGIELRVGDLVETGALLQVELRDVHGQSATSILACVVRVLPVGGGQWILSCTFIRQLRHKELRKLLAAR